MIKAKIFKQGKLDLFDFKQKYKVVLINGRKIILGDIIVNCEDKTIMCELKKIINEDERLAILKEVFYCFCMNKYYIEYLESYMFVDTCKIEEKNRVIDYLVDYDLRNFNNYDKKEKIIYHLKLDIDTIRYIEAFGPVNLGFIDGFTEKETNIYKRVLKNYLVSNDYRGELTESPVKRYNFWKKIYDLPASFTYWTEIDDLGIYDSIMQGIE